MTDDGNEWDVDYYGRRWGCRSHTWYDGLNVAPATPELLEAVAKRRANYAALKRLEELTVLARRHELSPKDCKLLTSIAKDILSQHNDAETA